MKQNDLKGANRPNANQNVVVLFAENMTAVDIDQMPNVERIAAFMQDHPEASCVIKGYASPEGNLDDNIQLANGRAANVMDVLVKQFGIAANRISAAGQGASTMIDELGGRVSICEIIVK